MVAILDTPWTHRMALRGFSAPIQSGRVHYNQLISLRYRSKYAKARGAATLPPPPLFLVQQNPPLTAGFVVLGSIFRHFSARFAPVSVDA